MHLGKFLNIVPLNEVLAQSVFGKNLWQIQPFDYGPDETLAADNQKDLKDQSMQNIIAHFAPKFILDAMNDLVTDENGIKLCESKVHTLTYNKDEVIAPTLARHLEMYHGIKPRQTDDLGQNTFGQYKQFKKFSTMVKLGIIFLFCVILLTTNTLKNSKNILS